MIDTTAIPAELQASPNWVVWQYEERHGRTTKVPYIASTGKRRASTVDPESWRTFDEAVAIANTRGYSGIGYVLTEAGAYAGVDLDHCVDPTSGDVDEWASDIAFSLSSYTEVTPSGQGLRVFVKGKLPDGVLGVKNQNVEVYCGKRFLTVTGRHVPKTPMTIEPREASLAMLYARYFEERERTRKVPTLEDFTGAHKNGHVDLSDDEIVSIASRAANGSKFRDLWAGTWETHFPSRSEADASLLGILAFYTQDPAQLERLFSSSGMARSKWWGRRDYRNRTLDFILSNATEHYSGPEATPTVHLNGKGPKPEQPAAGPETQQAPDPVPEEEKARWVDKPISLCGDGETVDWLWEGYLAPGVVTSLTALWKSGKTTLLAHALRAADGSYDEFAGRALREMNALVVTEEHESLWAGRREELGLKDNIAVLSRPFMGRPSSAEWTEFCLYLGDLVEKKGYTLVVFDTIFNLWCVDDENNNSQVIQALRPLYAITAPGAAVWLLAHPTKLDQGEGKSTRGGGAFGGFVDVILEMRRFDTAHMDDPRRVLSAISRYKDTEPEVVIELDREANVFKVVGTRVQVNRDERQRAVLEQLPYFTPGLTVEELHSSWGHDQVQRPSLRTLRNDLDQMAEREMLFLTGSGNRSDPQRYYRRGGAHLLANRGVNAG